MDFSLQSPLAGSSASLGAAAPGIMTRYIWNSLPNEVVEADTVNAFKYILDKHWSNLFDFSANLTGV